MYAQEYGIEYVEPAKIWVGMGRDELDSLSARPGNSGGELK